MATEETVVDDAIARRARLANSRDLWDAIWAREGEVSWRQVALERVYGRIKKLVPRDSWVVDVGGGVGLLAKQLASKCLSVEVWDHSDAALKLAQEAGFVTHNVDLERADSGGLPSLQARTVVATEVLEHLSDKARRNLLAVASQSPAAIFSVPNNCLGPDEEPQHTIKFTALQFLNLLREYWGKRCRVEVLGPLLLGVCGDLATKPYTLSVTFPARDEAADIEATLASFRGIADEMVIGIDFRTKDRTREIAERYAEVVFDINDPKGPPEDEAPEVHFAHCRNTCIKQCTGDWIFMTEAHERLGTGQDVLLQLDRVLPAGAKIGIVQRTANGQRDKWFFEWLFRNDPERVHFLRATHNFLTYPEGYLAVLMPEVRTIHDRVHERDVARHKQRKVQNRLSLMQDFLESGSEGALMYLGMEWREYDCERTIGYLEDLLVRSNNGPMRYMAKMILAKAILVTRRDKKAARAVLMSATEDDWSRTEHWITLGDLAYDAGKLEQAKQFYQYGSVRIGNPPMTQWWYDGPFYTYLPAQRLAMVCGELGLLDEGITWAKAVLDLLPDDAPEEVMAEARENVRQYEEALARKAALDDATDEGDD